MIGSETWRADFAIAQAPKHHDLHVADEIAVFTWRVSATGAMADQATSLLIAMGIITGLWAVCVGLLAWTSSRRRGAAGA